jgi:hypothetical protein
MTVMTATNDTNRVRGLSIQRGGEDHHQRGGEDHHQPLAIEHPWIYQFVDIIYVGTIFNVSWLIENCGSSMGVFGVTFCYLAIMYSTRLAFDEYYCISHAKGIIHLLAFCLYGAGVFVMAASINANPNHDDGAHHVDAVDSEGHEVYDYGHCTRRTTYDVGFACGFMTTRIALILMYILYFCVFHESNTSTDVELTTPDASRGAHTDEEVPTDNPLRNSSGASSTVAGAHGIFGSDRGSVVESHFSALVWLKIVPAVVSFFVMCGMLVGGNPAVVLTVVAGIEVIGWFLPSWLIRDDATWGAVALERHFAIERLGLFFMLVLGEAVLHLCRKVDPDKQEAPFHQYTVLL